MQISFAIAAAMLLAAALVSLRTISAHRPDLSSLHRPTSSPRTSSKGEIT
jgi:hypothetical protein